VVNHVEKGATFSLPTGDNGNFVGSYPEIADCLAQSSSLNVIISHTTASGDKFEPYYSNSTVKWHIRGKETRS